MYRYCIKCIKSCFMTLIKFYTSEGFTLVFNSALCQINITISFVLLLANIDNDINSNLDFQLFSKFWKSYIPINSKFHLPTCLAGVLNTVQKFMALHCLFIVNVRHITISIGIVYLGFSWLLFIQFIFNKNKSLTASFVEWVAWKYINFYSYTWKPIN